MREALRLAERGRKLAPPNPAVGCVLVRSGRVIARGYTHRPGEAHAEADALARLKARGESARGATAYVTLEPCNHTGRTPPCSEALIAAGVARVVVGVRDPNPIAEGGLERLAEAGVRTESGVLEAECRASLADWLHWVVTGRPRVTLKAAVTLDGRLAARGGDSRWVTGPEARLEAHRMRDRHQAILVGAGTVRADDPQLTTRLPEGRRGEAPARDPIRVILDGRLTLPAQAKALPALVVTTRDAPERPELERRGAELLRVRGLRGRPGRVDLAAMLTALGARGIQSLLVEGGAEVHGQLLGAGLVDQLAVFIAPKLIGSGGVPLLALEGPKLMANAWELQEVAITRLGRDVLVSGPLRQNVIQRVRVHRARRGRR